MTNLLKQHQQWQCRRSAASVLAAQTWCNSNYYHPDHHDTHHDHDHRDDDDHDEQLWCLPIIIILIITIIKILLTLGAF